MSELAPDIWQDDDLLPIVRDKLLEISEEFVDFLGIENLPLTDIILTGSMANYNWTDVSDIDLHIICDYGRIDCNDEIPGELFDAKRRLWNQNHNIMIGDHPVEVYVADTSETPKDSGVYSLLTAHWVKEPTKRKSKPDEQLVLSKFRDMIYQATYAATTKNPEMIEKVLNRIYHSRKEGLEAMGEYAPENLVFKLLRRYGILDKLKRAKRAAEDRNLSLSVQDLSWAKKKS